jgi:hypothetical protein
MAFRVDEFISKLPGGGARGNLFQVSIATPTALGLQSTSDIRFLAQTTTIPGATIGMTELSYFGRAVKIAGNKTFEDWTTTIINDEDFQIRRVVESWQESIAGNSSNTRRIGALTPISYMGEGTVTQFGQSGAAIREYKIVNMWPSVIADIELDWSTNDAVETFDVTWTYDHWVSQDAGDTVSISVQTPLGSISL